MSHHFISFIYVFSKKDRGHTTRLFFKTLQGSKLITEQIERPRCEHKLPNVLSKEEASMILQASKNAKHSTMLTDICMWVTQR
jgi:site-specific recombinase XerD